MSKKNVIFDRKYWEYLGKSCKCGYTYDEGDYQLKGKVDDFVNYNCDKCHDSFSVRLYKDENDLAKDSIKNPETLKEYMDKNGISTKGIFGI